VSNEEQRDDLDRAIDEREARSPGFADGVDEAVRRREMERADLYAAYAADPERQAVARADQTEQIRPNWQDTPLRNGLRRLGDWIDPDTRSRFSWRWRLRSRLARLLWSLADGQPYGGGRPWRDLLAEVWGEHWLEEDRETGFEVWDERFPLGDFDTLDAATAQVRRLLGGGPLPEGYRIDLIRAGECVYSIRGEELRRLLDER
jgi:hypothetical protein